MFGLDGGTKQSARVLFLQKCYKYNNINMVRTALQICIRSNSIPCNNESFSQSKLFVLYEHSAGFALFRVAEFEELAAFLPQVEESVTDLQRFNSVVTLIAFQPFKSAITALENINAVSEGQCMPYVNVNNTIKRQVCFCISYIKRKMCPGGR